MLLALDAGWYPLPPPRCPVGGEDTHTLGPTLCKADDDPVDLVDLEVIVVAPVDAPEPRSVISKGKGKGKGSQGKF